jgi:outer membrane protein assembly factor BamB
MRKLFLSAAVLLFTSTAFSQENQLGWRGPKRDGVYPEKGLLQAWPEGGPTLLWSSRVGFGYSSPTVEGDFIYITSSDSVSMREFMKCLSAKDGKEVWSVEYGKAAESYEGSRSTPTVLGDTVYAISGGTEVVSVDKKSGKIVWSVDGLAKFEASKGRWGFSESPLVFDNMLIFCPAGKKTTVVALNNQTGETIWESESLDQKTAYHIPRLITHNGNRLIITAFDNFLIGVEPSSGKILWQVEFADPNADERQKKQPRVFPNTALYKDGMVYATGGYGYGGVMVKLSPDGKSATEVWRSAELDTHIGGVVELDGVIYGSTFGGRGTSGKWVAVDWISGKTLWSEAWEGRTKGSIVAADGKLYVYEEKRGSVGLIKPSKEKLEVMSTFDVSSMKKGVGEHWAHPVVANGVLYIRHGDELKAYSVK